MNASPNQPRRPNYGIDAPGLVLRFAAIGIISFILGCALIVAQKVGLPIWTRFPVSPLLWMGVSFLLTALVMLWGSKIGKLRLRDRVIARIPWRGDEMVLDVGCGHGLMLIGAAKRLHSGKAIGIDLWQTEDQAGNSRAATWRNIEIENVADRVELHDGDARALPFASNQFDVVLSSWALHNVYDRPGRDAALREIIRVLKPGGGLAIIDIRHTAQYAETLQAGGMLDIQRSSPNFLFIVPSYSIVARKPCP
jgi:SAM-dependent methyltransferase